MSLTTWGWLVIAFPLAGTIVLALGYRLWPGRLAGWIGDLFVQLTHTDTGTTVSLLDINVNCAGDNIRVLLDDEAGTQADNVCGVSPPAINGTYRPTQSLSAFDGEMVDGEWIIDVYDVALGDMGTVLGAVLSYTVQS